MLEFFLKFLVEINKLKLEKKSFLVGLVAHHYFPTGKCLGAICNWYTSNGKSRAIEKAIYIICSCQKGESSMLAHTS